MSQTLMQHPRHGFLYVSTDGEIEVNEKRGWKVVDKHPSDKTDKAATDAAQRLTPAQTALSKKAADLGAQGNITALIALAGTVGVSVPISDSQWSAERIQQAIAATFTVPLRRRAAKLYEDGDVAGLIALAEASGVKVDQRWTESRIRDAINDADLVDDGRNVGGKVGLPPAATSAGGVTNAGDVTHAGGVNAGSGGGSSDVGASTASYGTSSPSAKAPAGHSNPGPKK